MAAFGNGVFLNYLWRVRIYSVLFGAAQTLSEEADCKGMSDAMVKAVGVAMILFIPTLLGLHLIPLPMVETLVLLSVAIFLILF